MAITRFTTPPISLLVKGVDITAADVYVTIKQYDREVNLTDTALTMTTSGDDTQITFSLTQAQAGALDIKAYASVQVNWIDAGVRYATEIANVKVLENLYDEVIS